MAIDQSLVKGKKQNNRTSGAAKALKLRKREEAEARKAAYANVPMKEKLERAGAKERKKLLAKVEKQILAETK